MVINEEKEGVENEELPAEEPHDDTKLLTHLGDKDIIKLKINSFPKVLVPLEELFDHNDVAKTPGVVPLET